MRNSVDRFSDRVESYQKYRPGYPSETVEVFRTRMGMSNRSKLADIGSGTGIFCRPFLENGNRVFGVEPNKNMRDAAEKSLAMYPSFTSIDGTAESTGLEEQSVDFVTAAQAFHWFDFRKSKDEFRRVLKPGGFTALIWNERQLDSTLFLRDYERFLIEFGTDYQKIRHDRITKTQLEDAFGCKLFETKLDNLQTLDFEGLKGRTLSASYVPNRNSERYKEMIKKLETLFATYAEKGKIHVLYDTLIYYGQI